MARNTLPKVVIPAGYDWVEVTQQNAYVQNIDDEPIIFAFGDVQPAINKEDGHRFKQELDDHYTNEAGDTLWVHQEPHKVLKLAVTVW